MVFPNANVHDMTLVFLLVVGALMVTLVWLFSVLDQSPMLMRLRDVLIPHTDKRQL